MIRHHQIRASKTCPGNFITIPMLLQRVPPASAGLPTAVKTIVNLNVRANRPSVTAPIVTTIPANTVVNIAGSAAGDAIHGNATWYRDSLGNFFWAGGTNLPSPSEVTAGRE